MDTAARVPARRNYSATQFLDRHDAAYSQIWQILGQKWGNLLLDAAFASTIGSGNQKQFNPNFKVTTSQRRRLMSPLKAMGWYDGMPLTGQYPNLLMQGMSLKGMIAMVTMVLNAENDKASNLAFGRMFALGGQRVRSDKLDGTVEEIYGSLDDVVCDHSWVKQQMLLMEDDDCMEPYKGAFATEFELFILAILIATNGGSQVSTPTPAHEPPSECEVPPRLIEACRMDVGNDGSRIITVINAPAERRGRGEARPTSKGNIKHWMDIYELKDGSTVVIAASRNGTARVLATSEAMLHSINNTITVLGFAGPPEGKPQDHFVAMLSETANMVLKAAEAYLNRMLPNGATPLTSRDVKKLLDRLVKNPTPETVSDIVNEVTLDLLDRAA